MKKELVDLPCYSSPHVQDNFRKTILEAGEDDIELVKILVPLTDNPNSTDETGVTQIFWAAESGNTEIVNPNSVINGVTPISRT